MVALVFTQTVNEPVCSVNIYQGDYLVKVKKEKLLKGKKLVNLVACVMKVTHIRLVINK